jgi:ATP-binding cassette subfamily C (CFTR/MRP) protein 1
MNPFTKMGMRALRSNLFIIPQDSLIFEGTMRQNLDRVGERSDDELWRVLELSHLKEHVKSMEGGLDAAISEALSNLSAGQRQLMCFRTSTLTQLEYFST